MAYINLNVYEEIEARELIDFVRSLDSKCLMKIYECSFMSI